MEKRVKINYKLSSYVEKLFFEYNASLNVLRYLTSQDGIKQKHIDKCFEDVKNKQIELELAKKEVSGQYQPKNECFERYIFDFNNCEIVFIGGECHE